VGLKEVKAIGDYKENKDLKDLKAIGVLRDFKESKVF
jgi:hypothetical protein